MGLDAVEQPMVNWPYSEIGLVHAECPFDKVQVAVILGNLLILDLTVGNVSLKPVQSCVLGYLIVVYGDGRFPLQGEEPVVASVVDGCLRDLAAGKPLLKPSDAFFPILGILLGTAFAH